MTHEIRSPIPGVFYRKSGPDADPFVEVGDAVTPESVVGLVEVMKTFHDLVAGVDGIVISVDVDDGAMVDAGQTVVTVTTPNAGERQ